ncbi:putative mitogen-activated protein kinase kinase kinase, partial [Entamoeba invadens IP1]
MRFVMLFLLITVAISVNFAEVEWCKYQNKLECCKLGEKCSPHYQWSLSNNQVELPYITDGFTIKCEFNTELNITINKNSFYSLKFDEIGNYNYSKNSNSFIIGPNKILKDSISVNQKGTTKGSCAYCKVCVGTTLLCSECNDGYYLSSGSCFKCHSYCATCFNSSYTGCYTCNNGYYLTQVSKCL